MSSVAGKSSLVKIAATDTSNPVVIGGLFAFSHDAGGQNLEDAEFGDQFIPRISNLRDAKVTMEGARRASDAGQVILMAALASGDSVWLTIRPSERGLFRQELKIAKFTTDVQVDGRAEFTCECEGTGVISESLPGMRIGTENWNYLRTQDSNYLTSETD